MTIGRMLTLFSLFNFYRTFLARSEIPHFVVIIWKVNFHTVIIYEMKLSEIRPASTYHTSLMFSAGQDTEYIGIDLFHLSTAMIFTVIYFHILVKADRNGISLFLNENAFLL